MGASYKNLLSSAGVADVVTLGDTWLGPAIQRGLVRPIPGAESSRWWGALPRRWQDLVRRNGQGLNKGGGDIYAAPYRCEGAGTQRRKFYGPTIPPNCIPPMSDGTCGIVCSP